MGDTFNRYKTIKMEDPDRSLRIKLDTKYDTVEVYEQLQGEPETLVTMTSSEVLAGAAALMELRRQAFMDDDVDFSGLLT